MSCNQDVLEKSTRAQAETNCTSSIKVKMLSMQVIQSCVVSVAFKGALCSFCDKILVRRQKSSLTDFFMPKQI